MNTTEFAKAENVNYQTVIRIVRRLQAEDGTKSVKGQHFVFTPEFEQRVRGKLVELFAAKKRAEELRKAEAERAKTKKVIRSTEAQRRDWAAVWSKDFMECTDRSRWVDFACVLASVEHSRFPGWLSKQMANGQRIGDRVLSMAINAAADGGDYLENWGGFTGWLMANGFQHEDKKELAH